MRLSSFSNFSVALIPPSFDPFMHLFWSWRCLDYMLQDNYRLATQYWFPDFNLFGIGAFWAKPLVRSQWSKDSSKSQYLPPKEPQGILWGFNALMVIMRLFQLGKRTIFQIVNPWNRLSYNHGLHTVFFCNPWHFKWKEGPCISNNQLFFGTWTRTL